MCYRPCRSMYYNDVIRCTDMDFTPSLSVNPGPGARVCSGELVSSNPLSSATPGRRVGEHPGSAQVGTSVRSVTHSWFGAVAVKSAAPAGRQAGHARVRPGGADPLAGPLGGLPHLPRAPSPRSTCSGPPAGPGRWARPRASRCRVDERDYILGWRSSRTEEKPRPLEDPVGPAQLTDLLLGAT